MIRVIVADDEEKVCRLICHMVDFERWGMELVGTADNGLSALELIGKYKPDLVITDICMPGCSGLELLQKARELSPDMEFIIISGYSHFEYAQTAIRYGISDYILKPISQAKLEAALEKISTRYHERRQERENVSRLQNQVAHTRERDLIWRDMESGQLPQTAEACCRKYGISFEGCVSRIFCIRASFLSNEDISRPYADYVLEQLKNRLPTVAKKQAEEIFRDFLLRMGEDCIYGLLVYEPDNQRAVRNLCADVMYSLRVDMHEFRQVCIHVSASRQKSGPELLGKALEEAVYAMDQRILVKDNLFLEEVPENTPLDLDSIFLELREGVQKSLDLLNEEELKDQIRLFRQHLRGACGSQLLEAVNRAYYAFLLSEAFQHQQTIQDLDQKKDDFKWKTAFCSTADNLFGLLTEGCTQELEALREQIDREKQRPIDQARKYIQAHYAEQISLSDVCSYVGFSASYFSSVFRKETGQTFLEFLAEIRLEQAKKLLRETKLTMEKICEQVGISDYKRFAKRFKRETGISPKEYRNLYT